MIGPSIPAHLSKQRDDKDEPEPSTSNPIGPELPPSASRENDDDDDGDDAWAPALPPDLEPASTRVIGPSIPTRNFPPSHLQEQYDSDDDDYGPMPLPASSRAAYDADSGVREFIEREERRKKELEV
jgi:hypothetical protein